MEHNCDERQSRIRQSAERTAEVSAGLSERLAADERRETHNHPAGYGCTPRCVVPSDHDTDQCECDERRERFETALRRTEGAEYYETDDAYFAALADAAMAVADAEAAHLGAELVEMGQELSAYRRELKRTRSKLRATLARVGSVLDSKAEEPDSLDFIEGYNQALETVRAALGEEGEQ